MASLSLSLLYHQEGLDFQGISPDSRVFRAAGDDACVLCDLITGKLLHRFDSASVAGFSHDGLYFLLDHLTWDGELSIHETASATTIRAFKQQGLARVICSPSVERIYIVAREPVKKKKDDGEEIEVWRYVVHADDWKRAARYFTLAMTSSGIGGAGILLSPGGRYLFDFDNRYTHVQRCQAFDARTGEPCFVLDFGIRGGVAFSGDSRWLTVTSGNVSRLWNLDTQQMVKHTRLPVAQGALRVLSAPGTLYQTYTAADGFIKLRDAAANKIKYRFPFASPPADVKLSRDGRLLAVLDGETIYLYDLKAGAQTQYAGVQQGGNLTVHFSPCSKYLVLARSAQPGEMSVFQIT